MIRLREMRPEEFDPYGAATMEEFGREQVRVGNWREEDAPELARRTIERTLPQGLASPGQHLFVVEEEESGESAGILWFEERKLTGRTTAWIYDIRIDAAFRRRGYGRETLRLLEERARELGLSTVALHVFGHNTAARALYEKAGYETTQLMMAKALEPPAGA
jgi:ribosomal protein S18 acetylase RimI-like enzyme